MNPPLVGCLLAFLAFYGLCSTVSVLLLHVWHLRRCHFPLPGDWELCAWLAGFPGLLATLWILWQDRSED